MPKGLLNQVSAELSRYIMLDEYNNEEVWSNAVNFEYRRAICHIYEDSFKKTITIKAKGEFAQEMVFLIVQTFEKITSKYKGVKPEIRIPCNCKKCTNREGRQEYYTYDRLEERRSDGKKTIHCNNSDEEIFIEDLLFGSGFSENMYSDTIQLKTITIFLASSSELETDRKEFEIFINRENKELIKRGIFIRLEIWEDFVDCMSRTRSQDEYNKAVRSSDIFVCLFFTKVGKYTDEEFDTAYGQFIKAKKPLVDVYMKDALINSGSLNKNDTNSLFEFKEKLSRLNHFPTKYKNIDDLKYQFKMQLDKFIKQPRNNSDIVEYQKTGASIVDSEASTMTLKISPTITKSKKVFISYSRKDVAYKDELKQHLNMLKMFDIADNWSCEQITIGKWHEQIQKELEESDLIIYMLSANFFSSEYIIDEEVKKGMYLIGQDPNKKALCVIVSDFVGLQRLGSFSQIENLDDLQKTVLQLSDWQYLPYGKIANSVTGNVEEKIIPLKRYQYIDEALAQITEKILEVLGIK
jgi:hypothetical protein